MRTLSDSEPSSLPVSAHCGWCVLCAHHTMTCALARHRSECEFYLEHFVVQLHIYVVCILCIYTLEYFLFMSFAHSRQFLHIYIYHSQSELCIALYISGMVFLFNLSVLPYLTVLFCNLYFIKCLFITMMFHADLGMVFTLP